MHMKELQVTNDELNVPKSWLRNAGLNALRQRVTGVEESAFETAHDNKLN